MKLPSRIVGLFLFAASIIHSGAQTTSKEAESKAPQVKNVVLVHGAFADGSGWRGVYDELTHKGYRVSVVQNPLTSLEDDVAATRRILARQDGPTILVGPFLWWNGDHGSRR